VEVEEDLDPAVVVMEVVDQEVVDQEVVDQEVVDTEAEAVDMEAVVDLQEYLEVAEPAMEVVAEEDALTAAIPDPLDHLVHPDNPADPEMLVLQDLPVPQEAQAKPLAKLLLLPHAKLAEMENQDNQVNPEMTDNLVAPDNPVKEVDKELPDLLDLKDHPVNLANQEETGSQEAPDNPHNPLQLLPEHPVPQVMPELPDNPVNLAPPLKEVDKDQLDLKDLPAHLDQPVTLDPLDNLDLPDKAEALENEESARNTVLLTVVSSSKMELAVKLQNLILVLFEHYLRANFILYDNKRSI